jgi:uncharacterized membrane protein
VALDPGMRYAARVRRRQLAGLAFAIAVGAVARFAALNAQPIWHDEVYTRMLATGHRVREWAPALYRGEPVERDAILAFQRVDPARGVDATVRGLMEDEPQHPPAYYVAARAWMGLFGDGLGALRALSAVLGLVLLAGALWLGRELFGSARDPSSLLFTALVAVSPFFVLFAREAREYTAFGALTLASSAALLRALRIVDEGGRRAAVPWAFALYAALTTLGLYTALSHAWVVLAHALFVAWTTRGRLTQASVGTLASLLASALAFVPWGLALVAHLDALAASLAWSHQIVVPKSELGRALLVNLARPILDVGDAPTSVLGWAATLLVVALVLASLVHLRRAPAPGRALVVLLFALPLALLLGPDLIVGGIRSLSTRYLVPTLLAVLIAVSHRVATLPRQRLGAAAILLSVALGGTFVATRSDVPWSRSLSAGLPTVAAEVNASERPLVIGDRERHHPGNLLALATLVDDETQFLLLDHPHRAALLERLEDEVWPAGLPADRTLFLYSPVPELRAAFERARGGPLTLVYEDLHVQCWRIDPPPRTVLGR